MKDRVVKNLGPFAFGVAALLLIGACPSLAQNVKVSTICHCSTCLVGMKHTGHANYRVSLPWHSCPCMVIVEIVTQEKR